MRWTQVFPNKIEGYLTEDLLSPLSYLSLSESPVKRVPARLTGEKNDDVSSVGVMTFLLQ